MDETAAVEKLAKLKVIVSEVDGILTDGSAPFDELGNVPFKQYNLRDLEAVNELKKEFKVVFMSKYQEVNYNFFRRKNIPFYWAKNDKVNTLRRIAERYSVTLDEVLFIGSLYTDATLLRNVPFSLCTVDAPEPLKLHASKILEASSGQGVLCEVLNLLQKEISRRSYAYKENH